ncbi:hypothetical protein BJ165DRAFT_1508391 [Panaeolus papilionaceus]|nr:hypothetical protein BJ165DRAFT_1508391 [Panaeolus papilionaceus]
MFVGSLRRVSTRLAAAITLDGILLHRDQFHSVKTVNQANEVPRSRLLFTPPSHHILALLLLEIASYGSLFNFFGRDWIKKASVALICHSLGFFLLAVTFLSSHFTISDPACARSLPDDDFVEENSRIVIKRTASRHQSLLLGGHFQSVPTQHMITRC